MKTAGKKSGWAMRASLVLCWALFVPLESLAEPVSQPDSTVLPTGGFFPGWSRSDTLLRFSGQNLYGYINGGAELFLEFGFAELLVQRYTRGKHELLLEIYRMTCSEAALGIYLMKCGDETPIEGISARNSGNHYQFTVVQDRYFVLANNFAGDTTLLPAMVALTDGVLAAIPENKSVELLNHLPPDGLIPGSERIIRGPYALQPIFTFGEGDMLQLHGEVFGVLGNYADTAGHIYTRIVIPYPDKKAALSAYRNLLANLDPYLKVRDTVENAFIFEDYQGKFGTVEIRDRVINIGLRLPEQPAPLRNRN